VLEGGGRHGRRVCLAIAECRVGVKTKGHGPSYHSARIDATGALFYYEGMASEVIAAPSVRSLALLMADLDRRETCMRFLTRQGAVVELFDRDKTVVSGSSECIIAEATLLDAEVARSLLEVPLALVVLGTRENPKSHRDFPSRADIATPRLSDHRIRRSATSLRRKGCHSRL